MPPYYPPPGYHPNPYSHHCPQCQVGPRNDNNQRLDEMQGNNQLTTIPKKQLNFESPDPPKKTPDGENPN